jgi:hypothetical protein
VLPAALAAAGLSSADVVLVFGLSTKYHADADAQLVATLLQLRRVAAERKE